MDRVRRLKGCKNKQAGAELCQAQYKAKLSPAGVVAWLSLAKNNNRNSIR